MAKPPSNNSPSGTTQVAGLKSPAALLATGLGLGLVAVMPGTVGTLVEGMPLAWAISQLPGPAWQAVVIAALFGIGVPLCTAAGCALGGSKDNQAIIYDEIITTPVVFLIVPLTNWKIAVTGFVLHRLFDITKPPPARQLERLPEGLGVMADDLMAAIYACVTLAAFAWLCERAGWGVLSVVG
jgi:phosphatidylglycerophosphatase A